MSYSADFVQTGVDIAKHVIPVAPQVVSTITTIHGYYAAQQQHPEYVEKFISYLNAIKEQVQRTYENRLVGNDVHDDAPERLLDLVHQAEQAVRESFQPLAVAKICQAKMAMIQSEIRDQMQLIIMATTQSTLHATYEIKAEPKIAETVTSISVDAKGDIDVGVVESDSLYTNHEHVSDSIKIAKDAVHKVLSKDTVKMQAAGSVALAKFNFKTARK